jgi:hypothetical protein
VILAEFATMEISFFAAEKRSSFLFCRGGGNGKETETSYHGCNYDLRIGLATLTSTISNENATLFVTLLSANRGIKYYQNVFELKWKNNFYLYSNGLERK